MADVNPLVLVSDADYRAAVRRFPVLETVLARVQALLEDRRARGAVSDGISLWVFDDRLYLHLTRNDGSTTVVCRRKPLIAGFWSQRFYELWRDSAPSAGGACYTLEVRSTGDVVARGELEAYVYRSPADRARLEEAVAVLETLPAILLEAHFDSSQLPRRMTAFYNEYLVDLFSTDRFQCLSKDCFDRMPLDRRFVEVSETLQSCGRRLGLFRHILGPVDEWLRASGGAGVPPVPREGALHESSLILFEDFRSRLLQVWTSF